MPLLAAALGVGVWAGQAAPSVEFEARGRIFVTNAEVSTARQFEVFVRDCQWLICSRGLTGTNDEVLTVGYENQGVLYKLTHKEGRKSAFGIIESNTLPTGAGGLVPILWPFFASGCLFPGNGKGPMVPVYRRGTGVLFGKPRTQYAEWTNAYGTFGPPTELIYYGADLHEKSAGRPLLPAASFRVLRATNLGHVAVPLQGQYYRYRKVALDEVVVAAFGQFEVDQVQPRCTLASFRPAIPAGLRLSIQDRRLLHTDATNRMLIYAVLKGVWPDLEQAQRLFAAQRRVPRTTATQPGWMVAGVVVLLALPFVFFALRKRPRTAPLN